MPTDGLDVLAKVGGFEIAGLVGRHPGRRGAAACRSRSTASSPVPRRSSPSRWRPTRATRSSPRIARPSRATRLALTHLGLEPYLDLGLRLGEGTGAALFVHLVRAAGAIFSGMATFKSAGVDGAVR